MLGAAGGSRGADETTAPDGTFTADRYSVGTGSGTWYIANYVNPSIVSGQAYTFSVYVKANGTGFVFVRAHNNYGNFSASGFIVSLSDGSVTYPSAPLAPACTATVTNAGNGWWRISATSTATSSATTSGGPGLWPCASTSFNGGSGTAPANFTGDGVSGIYIWGAQFEQGSNATTYTPTTTAAVYGPRFDYDPGNVLQQNLILNSQTFNASPAVWAFSNIVLSLNVAQAPDGTNTASLITTSPVGSAATINGTGAALSIIPTPNTVVTRSFYLKYSFGNGLFYSEAEGGASGVATFDLVNISASASSGSATITAVGNGWYRCSHTYTTAASPNWTTKAFYLQAYGLSTAAAGLFIWGFQFNYGSTALPYLATTSTTQAVCAPRGLLIEEARTNLNLQSGFASGWTANRSTGTINNTVSPDGSTNGYSLIEDTTASTSHFVRNSSSITITNAVTYSLSVYAKANGRTWIAVQGDVTSGFLGNLQYFDIGNGVVGTLATGVTSASIQNVGNGWYRCSYVTTSSGVSASLGFFTATGQGGAFYTGNGLSGVFLYGAQLEAGAFATSYIPTTSVTVTRNFDNLSITSTNFASWFNQTTGTFAVQYDVSGSYATSPAAFTVTPNGGFNITGVGNASWWNGSTNVSTANAISTLNTTRKEAMAYAASSRALCLNGGAVASDANVPFSGALTGMYFGSAYGGGTQNINGHIRSFSYYNYALTNAQLQQITT